MGDAAEVEEQAGLVGDGGARRPAARGEQGQALEEDRVAVRIGIVDLEAGNNARACVSGMPGVRPWA
jgi:hypothetical protein